MPGTSPYSWGSWVEWVTRTVAAASLKGCPVTPVSCKEREQREAGELPCAPSILPGAGQLWKGGENIQGWEINCYETWDLKHLCTAYLPEGTLWGRAGSRRGLSPGEGVAGERGPEGTRDPQVTGGRGLCERLTSSRGWGWPQVCGAEHRWISCCTGCWGLLLFQACL